MRVELAIVAVLMSGCSVVTMERSYRSHRPETTPRCTSNWRPQTIDALGALAHAVATIMLERDDDDRAAAVGATISGALLASALYGWVHRGWCLDSFEAHDRYLRTLAPPPVQVGPPSR